MYFRVIKPRRYLPVHFGPVPWQLPFVVVVVVVAAGLVVAHQALSLEIRNALAFQAETVVVAAAAVAFSSVAVAAYPLQNFKKCTCFKIKLLEIIRSIHE